MKTLTISIFLIISRALDVITTMMCIEKYGDVNSEANPINRVMLTNDKFIEYQILGLLVMLIVMAFLRKSQMIKIAFLGFSVISFFVAISNLIIYLSV